MVGAVAAETPATAQEPAPHRWSREAGPLDLLAIIAAAGLAPWTVWTAAVPVPEFFMFGAAAFLWPTTGVVWAIAALRAATNDTSRMLFLVLAISAGLTLGGVAPLLLAVLAGPVPIIVAFVAALAAFALALSLEPHRRIAWLVGPAIVLATIGLAVSGLPALARFAASEPALTRYAQQVLGSELPADDDYWDDPRQIGSYEVYFTDVRGGCVRLATAFVGILGDVPAGLAYCPNAAPVSTGFGATYEPFSGSWYRWLP